MHLKLYDTYQKSIFELPLDKTIKIYSCGPTVYSYLHIGNVVAVLLPDLITNVIKYCGGEVTWVSNVTDLGHLVGDGDSGEDKMEVGAKKENKTAAEVAQFYFDDFKKQLELVNIDFPTGFLNPKATDYIYEQMYIALELIRTKRAYVLEDGIYFDSEANSDLDKSFLPKSSGDAEFTGRAIVGERKNSEDFALWKFVEPQALQKYKFEDYPELKKHFTIDSKIESLWGCPGWHTECVAMIAAVLGFGKDYKANDFSFTNLGKEQSIIDIHTGGEDHIEIHHKNELLQSMALGVKLSDHWVHNKHLKVDNQKMSKSVGNTFNIIGDKNITGIDSVTAKGFNPLAFRLLFLEHDYQEQINFTWDKLSQAQNRLHSLTKLAASTLCYVFDDEEIEEGVSDRLYNEFTSLLLDNLNTSKALELFQKELTEQVTIMTKGEVPSQLILNTLSLLDEEVLKCDIFQYPDLDFMIIAHERRQAKENKDYIAGDKLRNELLEENFIVDDYKWGTGLWKK